MALELKLENGPTITLGEFPSGTVAQYSWMATATLNNGSTQLSSDDIGTVSLGTNLKAIASQLTESTMYKVKKAGIMKISDHDYRLYPYHDQNCYMSIYGRISASYLSSLHVVVEIDSGTNVKGWAWKSSDAYAPIAWGLPGLQPWDQAGFAWWKSEIGDTLYPRDAMNLFLNNAIEPSTKPYQISYGSQTLLTGETEDNLLITYRGQSLTTTSEGIKTLKTSNKVATDDIAISDGTDTKKLKCKGKKLTDDIIITIQ